MSDLDRFTAFLRREARGYNEAPRVPGEAMWGEVEAGLGDADRERGGVVDGGAEGASAAGWETAGEEAVDRRAIDALGYNEAPPAPREEMWGRIEAAWGMRGGVGGGRVGIGEEADGAAGPAAEPFRAPWRWTGRRRVAGWTAALAAAASLVLGLALGRGARQTQPGEVGADPVFATVPAETTTPAPAASEAPQPALPAEPEPQVLAAGVLPLPGAWVDREAPATASLTVPEPQAVRFVEATLHEPIRLFPNRPALRVDREQLRFFGRAETLLTALRTDQRTPLTERDLAAWGRELLTEARMHLDLQDSRIPAEFAPARGSEAARGSGAGDAPDLPPGLRRNGCRMAAGPREHRDQERPAPVARGDGSGRTMIWNSINQTNEYIS